MPIAEINFQISVLIDWQAGCLGFMLAAVGLQEVCEKLSPSLLLYENEGFIQIFPTPR